MKTEAEAEGLFTHLDVCSLTLIISSLYPKYCRLGTLRKEKHMFSLSSSYTEYNSIPSYPFSVVTIVSMDTTVCRLRHEFLTRELFVESHCFFC